MTSAKHKLIENAEDTEGTTSYVDEMFDSLSTAVDDRRRRWYSVLLRTAQMTSLALSMSEVLTVVGKEVIEATGADACNSFLFTEPSLYGNYYIVEPMPPVEYKVPEPPDLFSQEALRTGKPVTATDAMSHPLTDKRTMSYFGIKSALAFPLVFRGEPIAAGFAAFYTHHTFSDEELEVVMAIAGAGAMSVINARLHEAAVHLAVAQERNRIAQEIHDSVCQTLATVKLSLNTLPYLGELSSEGRDVINRTKLLVDESYREVRGIIRSFREAGVTGDRLGDTLQDYARFFDNEQGVHLTNEVRQEDIDLLSQSAQKQLTRIIGEALSNVRRHAKAKNVHITSSHDSRRVIIEVTDDGCGFDVESAPTDGYHFGLSIMRERARAADGNIDVISMKPHGTRIRATIPYK